MGHGSSPLARGLHDDADPLGDRGRIIPARAGFTPPWGRRGHGLRDHPRSRGVYGRRRPSGLSGPGSSPLARGLRREGPRRHPGGGDHPRSRGVYAVVGSGDSAGAGSSPLARGLRGRRRQERAQRRIIPARAGFTRSGGRAGGIHGDHPRSRGVYAGVLLGADSGGGSSPLARGLHGCALGG